MAKKLLFIVIFLYAATILHAQIDLPKQPTCGCPLLTLGVYDTKVNFSVDSTVEKDSYAKVQKSGDHLKSTYAKQQSDQLKVMRVSKQGTLSELDFKSNATINRNGTAGNYSYDVNVQLTDAYTQATVVNIKETTNSLVNANDMIDSCVASFSPVLNGTIRNYQKKIRKESNYTKWVGLQWKAKPDDKKIGIKDVTTFTVTVTDCVDKMPVTNFSMHITPTDPSTGTLIATKITTNDSGEAGVLFTGLHKGESMVLPDFVYTSVNNKTIRDGIACSNQKVTVDEDNNYKIIMDAETTISEVGKDIKLHGECEATLKALDDGTYMLEPLDKTRNMNITVEKAEAVNADGAEGKLITPLQYTIPFLFTIGKIDKQLSSAHAILYLNTTSPQKGMVTWRYTTPDGTVENSVDIDNAIIITAGQKQALPDAFKGTLYAMDGVTGLNILTGLEGTSVGMQNINQNITNSQDQMAFAQRMQEHMNDPAYFKTTQGKADQQQMTALQKQVGGNITNTSNYTKNIEAKIAQKARSDPKYAGSKQFQQDMAALHMNEAADMGDYRKPPMAEVAPGTAIIRIEDTFNPKSSNAFTGQVQGELGPMKTTIKITVEKID